MDFQYKTEPFDHQRRFIDERWHYREDALLWEQGTAKTKAVLDKAARLYLAGEIDALLVMAPEDVHVAWVEDEIRLHMMDAVARQIRHYIFYSHRAHTQIHKQRMKWLVEHKGLAVMTMTYDAARTEKGRAALWQFLRKRRVLMACDESTRIKSPNAKVTKRIIAAGAYAPYKVILTGTPVANGPFDVYSQFRFLDPDFWKKFDMDGFAAFRAHFGQYVERTKRTEKGEQTWNHLVGYRNLEELHDIVAGMSTRYLKRDVLDLPENLYTIRYYDLTPAQTRHYLELEDEFRTWVEATGPCPTCQGEGTVVSHVPEFEFDTEGRNGCLTCGGTGVRPGDEVVAELAMVRQLRLHQVCCGYLPVTNPEDETVELHEIPGGNPRLHSMQNLMDETPGKMITWCRYRRDVEKVLELSEKLGRTPVRYDGSVPKGDPRTRARKEFQEGGADDFVGTSASAGEGLTLHAAKTQAHYSQNYNWKNRMQAEARSQRAGMPEGSVLHVDFVGRVEGRNTVDYSMLLNYKMKAEVAAVVTGDAIR